MYMAADNAREVTVSVKIDISEALTGLKAIQREAKEATHALRGLEAANGGQYMRLDSEGITLNGGKITVDRHVVYNAKSADLTTFSTAELQSELAKREGVETIRIDAHGGYGRLVVDNSDRGSTQIIEGPAIVTVNHD